MLTESSGRPASWREVKSFIAADDAVNGEVLSRFSLRLFRVGQWITAKKGRRWAPVRALWWRFHHIWFGLLMGVELMPNARHVGAGLQLRHGGRGAVIHPDAVIGKDVTIFHGVTVGTRGSGHNDSPRSGSSDLDVPTIAEGVVLFPGCAVLGDVHIGVGAVVGPGAMVIDDVPPQTTVVPPLGRMIPQAMRKSERSERRRRVDGA